MKIDELKIDEVLDNVASPEDARKVAGWFSTQEGGEYLSRRLEREIQEMSEEKVELWVPDGVPEERMRQRLKERMKPKRRTIGRWWWAAVVVPFLLLSASVVFFADRAGAFSTSEYAELVVSPGEQMRVVLQDGTIVHLNSATRLRYPKRFGMFSREVELWGEGYFEVAKEKDRPFQIELQGFKIRVTGTKFNVKSYEADSYVRVSLDEGGVVLKGQDKREYVLKAGECAEYDRRSGECRIDAPEALDEYSSWRSNSLNFYMTPLKEVIKVLERQYDIRFTVVDSTLLDCRFTFSTAKVDIRDILNDLQTVSYVDFRETEKDCFEIVKRQ